MGEKDEREGFVGSGGISRGVDPDGRAGRDGEILWLTSGQ